MTNFSTCLPERIGLALHVDDVRSGEGAKSRIVGEQADLDGFGEPRLLLRALAVGVIFPRFDRHRHIPFAVRAAHGRGRLDLEVVKRDPLEQVGDQRLLLGRFGFRAKHRDQVERARIGRDREAVFVDKAPQRAVDRFLADPPLEQIQSERALAVSDMILADLDAGQRSLGDHLGAPSVQIAVELELQEGAEPVFAHAASA